MATTELVTVFICWKSSTLTKIKSRLRYWYWYDCKLGAGLGIGAIALNGFNLSLVDQMTTKLTLPKL